MINTTKFTETIEREQVESITCDVCKKTYPNKGGNDYIEIQEFHHVDFIGGYGSVFGDETRVRCDICQYCLHGMIGGVIQGA